jgi:hypothetical protein
MNAKNVLARLQAVEQKLGAGKEQLIVAVIDASLNPRAISVNGETLSEEEYVMMRRNLSSNAELYEVVVCLNQPLSGSEI